MEYYKDQLWNECELLNEYKHLLPLINDGVYHLMFHPSLVCHNLINLMYGSPVMAKQREEELKLLLNLEFKSLLCNNAFKLINYKDIVT